MGVASLEFFASEAAPDPDLVRRLLGWTAREVSGLIASGPVTVTMHDPTGRHDAA